MFSYDVDAGEIHLLDEIGPEWAGMVGGSSVIEALGAMGGKDVSMYLSTPGGSVDEGTLVFNTIDRYPGKVTMIVDSIAASMGSYILQAADVRIVAANSKVMIHDPWSIAMGNAAAFRKEADVLEKYSEAMVPAYAKRSGKTEDEVRAIMAEETWYVGADAVTAGFADKVVGSAKGCIDMKALARWAKKIPQAVIEEQTARSAAQQRHYMTVAEARERVARVK